MKRSDVNLIPLGAVAVAAGCAGGAHNALPAQSGVTAPTQSQHATTAALLTVKIPARPPSKAKRAPKYISQYSGAIGYSIAASGATPPAETVTALPTPGPVATSVTLPVIAPVGADTISVHVYDALPSPGASATPNVLSEATTTTTVAVGQTAPINVEALGVPFGIILGDPTAVTETSNPATFEVFQNHPAPQSTTVAVTAYDADGGTITGAYAAPVTLTLPAGVTASPAALTGAATETITYGASQTGPGGIIALSAPGNVLEPQADLTVAATQYAFFDSISSDDATTTLIAIDPVKQSVVASTTVDVPTGFSLAAVAGCASGETVVVQSSGIVTSGTAATAAWTLALPSSTSAPITTDLTAAIAPNPNSLVGNDLAADASCGMYSAGDTTVTRYSGFPNVTAATVPTTGWLASSSVGVGGSTLYGTYIDDSGNLFVQNIPIAGGTASTPIPLSSDGDDLDFGISVGGANVYLASVDCSGSSGAATPVFSLAGSGEPAQFPGTASSGTQTNDGMIAAAPNGTLYQFLLPSTNSAVSALRARIAARVKTAEAHRHAASGNRSAQGVRAPRDASSPTVTIAAETGAVSADGRFLIAVGLPTDSTLQNAQVYALPATAGAAPVALGTPFPISTSATSAFRGVFPH